MGVERRVGRLFCRGKKGGEEERPHTLMLLNKLIDCSSWWKEEVALTQAEADWLTSLHSGKKDQSDDTLRGFMEP